MEDRHYFRIHRGGVCSKIRAAASLSNSAPLLCDCYPVEAQRKLLPEAFFRSPLESTVVYMTNGPGWLTPNGWGNGHANTKQRHVFPTYSKSDRQVMTTEQQRPSACFALHFYSFAWARVVGRREERGQQRHHYNFRCAGTLRGKQWTSRTSAGRWSPLLCGTLTQTEQCQTDNWAKADEICG